MDKYTTIHYHNYLQLDQLLSAQQTRSGGMGDEAHDETLFIIMHQVYELWFKQIIHELKWVAERFRQSRVRADEVNEIVGRLKRISEIMELLIKQIHVMETLTPLDFLDFRDLLFPASGFQSYQFRMVESMLGLRDKDRLTYHGKSYKIVFRPEQQQQLAEAETNGNLFELIEEWLERTPFLRIEGFHFLTAYREALDRMVEREQANIRQSDYLSEKMKEMRLVMLGDTDTYFARVLDPQTHEELIAEGKFRLSYRATLGALFINLYRDQPILNGPYNLLTELINIDELMTTWRYRHAQMVMRMIGNKVGTGGSSGHKYLAETAERHKIFKDLHHISSLLIPRSELPELPEHIERLMGFTYYQGRTQ